MTYTVFGNPIEHSLSPLMHTLFAQTLGQTISYSRTLAPLDGFSKTLNTMVSNGLKGANVTRPFKFEALQIATHITPRAKLAGAANTLRFDPTNIGGNKEWWADNTDGIGLVRDITKNAGVSIKSRRVLLIGAGGAAAGVLGPLIEAQPEQIVIANRTIQNAQNLLTLHQPLATTNNVNLIATELSNCGTAFDLIINSSGSSQDGRPIPVSSNVLKKGSLAVDMTYGKDAINFLQWADQQGAIGRDGLGMLVEQGAESFHFWLNQRPNSLAVLQELRAQINSPL